MRWDLLFADLEAQLDAADVQAEAHVLGDLTRAEQATISLADRLRGSIGGHPVGVRLVDGSHLTGQVRTVAADWFLLEDGKRRHVVPLLATTVFDGLTAHAVPAPSGTGAGRGLPTLLRALMRDRAVVRVRTLAGEVDGRVARVGKDHLDVMDTAGGTRSSRVVPFAALLCVSES
ncbi:hypothetical protein [Oerskovia turbata]|uniref:hypothetical protein n=1 Tax=Oerskovia turbata TaxID=1713 RepID=UPI0004BEACD5|nr:hypothetical protein [Oerskovia turbata]